MYFYRGWQANGLHIFAQFDWSVESYECNIVVVPLVSDIWLVNDNLAHIVHVLKVETSYCNVPQTCKIQNTVLWLPKSSQKGNCVIFYLFKMREAFKMYSMYWLSILVTHQERPWENLYFVYVSLVLLWWRRWSEDGFEAAAGRFKETKVCVSGGYLKTHFLCRTLNYSSLTK